MSKTEIVSVIGRQVLDSRGNPTVEAEVRLACGMVCTGIAPSGASTGQFEAHELRDNDMQLYGGKSVLQACKNVSGAIHKTLCGMDADDLAAIDAAISMMDTDAIVLIAIYPGHAEGELEGRLVGEKLSKLDRHDYTVACFRMMNSPTSPYFYIVEGR